MKIIALKGERDSGKTTTLNIVYQFMLDNDYIQIPNSFKQIGGDLSDFRDVLIKDSIKVGILTPGDEGPLSKIKLEELKNEGCHIVIIGWRNNVQLWKTANNNHTIIVNKSPKKPKRLQRIYNHRDAKLVLEELKLIKHL